MHPLIPTVLAYDNIDACEEMLSGAGTLHHVNGIIVQPEVSSCSPERKSITDKKDKRRTIESDLEPLPIYISRKRNSPPPLIEPNSFVLFEDVVSRCRLHNLFWILARFHDLSHQTISSWTGFNIKTRDATTITADKVGYLPTINAPATEISTAN